MVGVFQFADFCHGITALFFVVTGGPHLVSMYSQHCDKRQLMYGMMCIVAKNIEEWRGLMTSYYIRGWDTMWKIAPNIVCLDEERFGYPFQGWSITPNSKSPRGAHDKSRDVCFRVTSSHYVRLYWPVFSLSMLKLVPITCHGDIIPVVVKSEYL